LAEYLTGQPLGGETAGAASNMMNHCTKKRLSNPLKEPFWNGWGVDLNIALGGRDPHLAIRGTSHSC